MANFRLFSATFLLTYPRCDISVEDLETYLRNRWGDCAYVCVAHELHQDGFPHRHALLKFKSRHDCRERTFDFAGFHPSVERPKNWAASENYVKKGGAFIEWSDVDVQESNLFDIARQSGFEQFCNHCLTHNVTSGWANMIWQWVNGTVGTPVYDEDPNPDLQFPETEGLSMLRDLLDPAERITPIVNGPPGIGKTVTVLRLMPKPVMFVSHLDQLKDLTTRIRSIVLDDCSFLHLPRTAQLAIVDREMPHAIHRRYGTSLIPSGVMVVMTSNVIPVDVSDLAIARRVKLINLY